MPSVTLEEYVRLRKLYRTLVLAQVARITDKTLATMLDQTLNDIGQTRASFASALVEKFRQELDKQYKEVEGKNG